ncbi:MAG: hypothetical protein AAFX53_18445 [Bacteroidota bacterium]
MSIDKKGKVAKRKITIESLIIFFIAVSPFLYKLYDYFPDNPEDTVTLLGITIDNNGFHSVSVFFWFLMSKIIPLYLMLIWFFTCKNWWYHILLIPIAMYSFQVFEVLFDSDNNIDTENIWWLLPVCMVVIPFVYFIRIRIYDKHVHGIDLEAMETELETYRKKGMAPEKSSEDLEKDLAKLETKTLSERIDVLFSTRNIEYQFRQLHQSLRNWLDFRL